MLTQRAVTTHPPERCVAHTPSPQDPTRWHLWADHARGVGELAASFGQTFGAADVLRVAGYLHDAGKLTEQVQEALLERGSEQALNPQASRQALGCPHKQDGAALAVQLFADSPQMQCLLAGIILGHHHGIPNQHGGIESIDSIYSEAIQMNLTPLRRKINEILDGDIASRCSSLIHPSPIQSVHDEASVFRLELLMRMCHSALVDADFLDTSAHFSGERQLSTSPTWGMTTLWQTFSTFYEKRFPFQPATGINQVRQDLYRRAVEVALQGNPQRCNGAGIYRMAARTGTGKTLSAAAFALAHAEKYHKSRIVMAVPFTTITTQNAQVYRQAFSAMGDEVVLEHHSNISDDDQADNTWRRLSSQNWDAEFIVTTTVQLFESLFSNKPSKTRKLHRLVNAVIVLDEVQAIPLALLPAVLRMLRQLVDDYGVSVLLASATQPNFWDLPVWQDLKPIEVVSPTQVPESTRRVRFDYHEKPLSWEQVAQQVGRYPQALTILNTTGQAQHLYEALRQQDVGNLHHLSSRMCPVHRDRVLHQVRTALDQGQPLQLVSTQLIEAGVDVDFPVVYRALGPAESIVQSAGRANREGKLGQRGGLVVVFTPQDHSLPAGSYARATALMRNLLNQLLAAGQPLDIDDPRLLEAYFAALYQSECLNALNHTSTTVEHARLRLAFDDVATQFRMIDQATVPVVITTYGSSDDQAALMQVVEQCGQGAPPLSRRQRRLLQRYTVNLMPTLAGQQWLHQVGEGVHTWLGRYDPAMGVVVGVSDSQVW